MPLLQRDLRVHRVPAVGLAAAPVLGFLFGVGWTPCIGPTLGVVEGLAYQEGSALRGGVLLAAYTAGLGVPFVVAGLACARPSVPSRSYDVTSSGSPAAAARCSSSSASCC